MHLARILLIALALLLASVPAVAADPEPRTHEFAVSGMTCKLCPIRIEKGLETLAGVSSVEADQETGRVRVIAAARVSAEELESAIEKAGAFEADLVTHPIEEAPDAR